MSQAACTQCGNEYAESELEYSENGLVCDACAADARFGEMYDRGIMDDAKWGIIAIGVGAVLLLGAIAYAIWSWSAYEAIGAFDLRPLILLAVGGIGGLSIGFGNLRSVMRSRKGRKRDRERRG